MIPVTIISSGSECHPCGRRVHAAGKYRIDRMYERIRQGYFIDPTGFGFYWLPET